MLFSQADTLSGGAGWVGAGLLGLVLGWLLLKHLPDKDRQVETARLAHLDAQAKMVKTFDDRLEKIAATFSAELKYEREQCEKRDERVLAVLKASEETTLRAIDELRGARHAVKNVENQLQLAKVVEQQQKKEQR